MRKAFHQLLRKLRPLGNSSAVACLLVLFTLPAETVAQQNQQASAANGFISNFRGNLHLQRIFIENVGQYGSFMEGHYEMGPIRYGYEGLGMPVLFTSKGIVHLQRKEEKLSHREEEKLEKAGAKEEDIEREKKTTDRTITMEWVGANEHAEIITESKSPDFHTYGLLTKKAYGFKKIIYKNIYPGIDIVYQFPNREAAGFEYSIVAAPGADISAVKIKYGGDVRSIKINNKGSIIVRSDIEGITSTMPESYYGEQAAAHDTAIIKTSYKLAGNVISFSFPRGYDSRKAIILDPFVSSTSNLTGVFSGKAIDIDYDYAGNVYVAGGGSTNQTGTASHSHAKYNSAGVLLWTFNGTLNIPIWQAGYYYGGWVVDKATGALYIGQGFAFQGFQVVRVSTTGLYDNYISTASANFQEDWKMYWYCNNGNPQIICAGGGTTGNNNIAICNPPSSTLLASANLTGSAAAYQDMSDLVIDPVTNSLYSIYASGLDKNIENRIFKHNAPYSAATTAWSTPSGYTVLGEILNRPYLGGSYADNSSNILAVNASYLFYWDGQNLKAIDKATGTTAGTPLTLAGNVRLNQGGIVADACNNVFIGNTNGTIKVYKFNGTSFDDAAAIDITIPGYNTNVYDLALDESKKLLYAAGDGFVGSFDVSAYCPVTNFNVNVVPNCVTASATATLSPAPPPGSTVTYTLFNGNTQIGTANNTGIFTALTPNITYTVVATVNVFCSGTRAGSDFVLPGPTIAFTQNNTTCGNNTGTINATGSGTPGPYLYSLNGGAFQASGNFSGLAGGIYTLEVQGAGGCPNDTVITIVNSNGPALTFTQTNATCGNNTGTVTANAAGGTAPYQYSIDGGAVYQSGNFFTGLTAGNYILAVKDAAGCTNQLTITIISSPPVALSAKPASATCGQNNGSITAFGSEGTAPLQYSINGNIFQASNIFTGVTPGVYTVTVKDAIGCTQAVTVTVDNVPPPTVTAPSIGSTCGNINGSITATGSNGIPPYQYSINGGVSFQTGNVFTGLAPGIYTITIKDATGCTNFVAATVTNTNGPTVTASATTSACAANTGSITASVSGGTAPYQYSINGSVFFASNIFNGLAPGNYVLYARDNTGCTATVRVVVPAVSGPSITAAATPASCTANNGTITVTATGGTVPLQYSTDGITYGAGNIFTGLASALYTVYVKDAGGCIKTTTVIVGNASGLSVSVGAVTSSCSIGNGVITATATGGIAPLQYSIDGVSYQAGNVFNSLVAGTYTIYVKDANGCIVTKPANVTSVTGPSFTLTVQQNATCGTASGVIRVTATGGLPPLSYNIDGGAFQPAPVFVNVAPGLHSIIVRDASGCTAAAQNSTITNSGAGTAITDVTFTVRDVLGCTGEGRIKNLKGFPSGGGNNYEFSLDGGPFTTANQFRPVSAGYHTITARNRSSLCSITKLVTIGVGIPATATAVATPTACGASAGTITITGVGANTPYHASIDNGVTWQTFAGTFTFTGLAPASYPIIIADDADFTTGPPDVPGACLTTIFTTVPSTGGPSVSTTQTDPTCTTSTGSITAAGSGGTGPYTYSVDAGTYVSSGVFTNLAPGVHAVTVKDASGCINGVNITLANAAVPAVTADVVPTSCNLNNGTITATGTGGVAPLEYSIDGTVFVPGNIFTGLTPGNYTLYVRDANKCFSSVPVTIVKTALPKVTAFSIAATCNNNDGTIVAGGSLGQLPYTFSINGTAYQSSGIFNELAAGFYTVYIKDARGCVTTAGVTVTNIGAPTFTSTASAAKCGNSNGSITITANGGAPGYEYSSDGGTTFQASNILTPLSAGTYAVVIRDANGCKASGAVTIAGITGPQTLTAVIADAACGNANGTITATATGGTAPFQYSKDGTVYQASNVLAAAAGNYTLYVKDANGCIKTLPVTVLNLQAPLASTTSSPASCGSSDGTITVLGTGGTLALSYSKDGGLSYQPGNIFTGLAAGTYTISIKDAKGCISAPVTTTVSSFTGSSSIPTFTTVAPVCAGSAIAALPTTSLNGITGTWSPALINTATTTYTFTPSAGQCASTASLTITVTPAVIPTFNAVAAVCAGTLISPLPTTSLNGITGTWSPVLNNTATTTYTFTPSAGQCASTASLTIAITPAVIPTFNAVAPVCAGTLISPLPTTSLNGITGTWSPALNNTATTTYTFMPSAGQCASTASLTITVTPAVIPTFNAVAPVCAGTLISPLPTTSSNGITGTWSPALNNTATTTYTFTPTAGQCAASASLAITVNQVLTPVINCGVSTTASVSFTWAAVAGATGYSIIYQVGTQSAVNIGGIGNTLNYQVNGLSAGDIVSITVIPTGGTTDCFNSGTASCMATACTPPAASIGYSGPFCAALANVQPVILNGTGNYNGGVFSALPGLSLNSTTGGITPANSTPGTYSVNYTIAASGGCPGNIATTSVVIDPVIVPLFSAIAPICAGETPGTLPVTSLNGITGTWSPALNNSSTTTYTFTPAAGQCAGTEVLTIQVNALPAAPLVFTQQPDCSSPAGIIAVTTATTGLQFSLDGAAFTPYPAGGYSGVSPGTHSLLAQNNAGCKSSAVIIAVNAAPLPPTAIVTTSTSATCAAANGSFTLGAVTGGIAPYVYSVDGSSFTGTLTYTNLAAGSHALVVKDANGCSFSTTLSINNTSGATITAVATASSCGASNGSITANGSGGNPPYQYSIDGTVFQPGNLFTGLIPGVYTVTIKDAANCINSISISIADINGATVTAVTTAATCTTKGSIVTAGAGGTLPYQYSIDGANFQTGNLFSGLAAGNYTITIKDARGCINSTTAIIASSNVPTVTAVATAAACNASNGSITATGVSGAQPYQYSIDGIHFQTNNIFAGLAAGNYTVTIKDANACSSSTSVIVINATGASVTAITTPASCGTANGSITATGSGGSTPYLYAVNGTNFQPSNIFTGLTGGVYILTIKDANGCTSAQPVTVKTINAVNADAGNDISICQGATTQLTGSTNGTAYSWSPAAGLSNTGILTPLATPSATTTYILTAVTGQCIVSDTVTVTVLPPPVPFAGNDTSVCFGSTIRLHGSGGSSYQWSPAVHLSNAAAQNPLFTAAQPGSFTLLLSVKDNNGCSPVKKDTLVITILAPVKVFAGNDTAVALNQPIQLNAVDVNNSGISSYSWSPAVGLSNAFVKNPVVSLQSSNVFTYTVTAQTAAGCQATDEISIRVYLKADLYVPNAFTPNGDGRNDLLKVIPVGIRELKYFTIYNRWGEMVFTTKNLSAGWDGIYRGQKQDSNTFVWMAEAVDFNGNLFTRKGVALLIR